MVRGCLGRKKAQKVSQEGDRCRCRWDFTEGRWNFMGFYRDFIDFIWFLYGFSRILQSFHGIQWGLIYIIGFNGDSMGFYRIFLYPTILG
jgi:hypothetical protein